MLYLQLGEHLQDICGSGQALFLFLLDQKKHNLNVREKKKEEELNSHYAIQKSKGYYRQNTPTGWCKLGQTGKYFLLRVSTILSLRINSCPWEVCMCVYLSVSMYTRSNSFNSEKNKDICFHLHPWNNLLGDQVGCPGLLWIVYTDSRVL